MRLGWMVFSVSYSLRLWFVSPKYSLIAATASSIPQHGVTLNPHAWYTGIQRFFAINRLAFWRDNPAYWTRCKNLILCSHRKYHAPITAAINKPNIKIAIMPAIMRFPRMAFRAEQPARFRSCRPL